MRRVVSRKGLLPLILLWFSIATSAHAQVESESWSLKTQIGIWFGPVTPVPGSALSNVLTTSLGGGMFMRFNIPTNWLRFEVGGSYSYYSAKTLLRLHSIPVYGALSYTLPINLPLSFQIKAGAGGNFLRNWPDGSRNWLPLAYGGFEASFPAGRLINIGVRADYYFVYEKWLSAPANYPGYVVYNGNFFNFGLMVNFNLGS